MACMVAHCIGLACIWFAEQTNHVELLDPALIRPGRCRPSRVTRTRVRCFYFAKLHATDWFSATEPRIRMFTDVLLYCARVLPGRVDMRIKFEPADRDQVTEFVRGFYAEGEPGTPSKGHKDIDRLIDSIPSGVYTIAQLQGFLMQYRANPKGALQNISGLTSAER
eukprot:18772-Pyramimonas_sp.AAC.2